MWVAFLPAASNRGDAPATAYQPFQMSSEPGAPALLLGWDQRSRKARISWAPITSALELPACSVVSPPQGAVPMGAGTFCTAVCQAGQPSVCLANMCGWARDRTAGAGQESRHRGGRSCPSLRWQGTGDKMTLDLSTKGARLAAGSPPGRGRARPEAERMHKDSADQIRGG